MENYTNVILPVYVIASNSEKEEVKKYDPFYGKSEFEVFYLTRVKHNNFSISTWLTIKEMVKAAIMAKDDFIIISNMTHHFTDSYKQQFLVEKIIASGNLNCEILLGQLEKFNHAVPIQNNLFWIDSFADSSFYVLFKSLFIRLMETCPVETETFFEYLSYISSHKIVIYPFISSPFKEMDNKFYNQICETEQSLAIYKKAFEKYSKMTF